MGRVQARHAHSMRSVGTSQAQHVHLVQMVRRVQKARRVAEGAHLPYSRLGEVTLAQLKSRGGRPGQPWDGSAARCSAARRAHGDGRQSHDCDHRADREACPVVGSVSPRASSVALDEVLPESGERTIGVNRGEDKIRYILF